MRQSTSTWWKQCGDDGEVPDVLVRYAVVHPRDEFVLAHESFVVGQLTDLEKEWALERRCFRFPVWCLNS
jgi:hypothetical protein